MADGPFLSEKEIEEFLNDLDKNNNGYIEYDEIEQKLDQVHKEIAPEARSYNLHHADQTAQRHQFLRSVLGTDKNQISRVEFAQAIKGWNVPSTDTGKKAEEDHKEYMKKLSLGRRLRAFWSVEGPEVMFIVLVVSMQIGFGTWQLTKYATGAQYRLAFGWGVVLAKACAGILYPTLFFLVLSMSRWISTFARRFYHISRFVNWDLSQSFHIKISVCALVFASLHAIGHLTGTFLYGSRRAQESAVAALLGPDAVPRPYSRYIRSLPGWSGVVALGLFWTMAGLSAPFIRKRSYEIFQLGHLLMFPMIGLLIAHGTAGLLQFSMLGYWLAFPTLLVVGERITRIVSGLNRIPATLKILDADTVSIKVTIPERRYFPYKAGQYIFLQVPKLSLFQWHPFTISACIGNEMHLHIKTDGNWTSKLRDLAKEGQPQSVEIGIDGPFGAPAQRFYDFDQTIILGSGIGVTPFSGILTDLAKRNKRKRRARNLETSVRAEDMSEKSRDTPSPRYRRVDFHWIVKDRNYLLWFSDLLNRVSRSCATISNDENPHLDVHIQTHVTQKRKGISTYIFRYLLEIHRTAKHPGSPITGLLNSTNFGRPDLAKIMDDHYEVMLKLFKKAKDEGQNIEGWKVGVFFCGAPPIGFELADRCQILTLRGREDKNYIEYHFMMEVFG